MGLFDWFRRSGERRREARIRAGDLVAYYWTGATPEPHRVRDIGLYGAYIEAPEKFYPGTLIQMVLVDRGAAAPGPTGRFFACARAVDGREDGFGVEFPFLRGKERRQMRVFLDNLTSAAWGSDSAEAAGESADQGVTGDDIPAQPRSDVSCILFRSQEDDAPEFNDTAAGSARGADKGELPTGGEGNGHGSGRRAGQALIEFALILPLLFLLIVNVINFGGFIYAWISVSNAARAGAQYLSQGGSMVGGLVAPSLATVQTLVQNDLQGLPNAGTAQIRVCRVDGTLSCIGPGAQTPPAESAEPGPGGTTVTFAPASVDVTYTYTPFISLWSFPNLKIYSTIPPTTLHRQAVMRALQ